MIGLWKKWQEVQRNLGGEQEGDRDLSWGVGDLEK